MADGRVDVRAWAGKSLAVKRMQAVTMGAGITRCEYGSGRPYELSSAS